MLLTAEKDDPVDFNRFQIFSVTLNQEHFVVFKNDFHGAGHAASIYDPEPVSQSRLDTKLG